jgi:hypothetical protein
LVGMFLPIGLVAPDPDPAPAPGRTLQLPYGEAQCVRLVMDLARRTRRGVRVVDVSQPAPAGAPGPLPPGRDEFYPILVAPGGDRLAGEPDFTPGRVRRFLKHG